ncbi:DUF4145 domain-containing protein [Enterococcus faecalis]
MLKIVEVEFPETPFKLTGNFNLSDNCPHCKNFIQPIVIHGRAQNIVEMKTENKVAVMLQCPNEKCKQFFLDWFSIVVNSSMSIETITDLVYTYSPVLENDLPKDIEIIFPDFTKIYNQSIGAEVYKLDQIAGIGYRKSLEFLIKDYAIRLHPQKIDSIKQDYLKDVISKYFGDFPKLQSLATAASWIGNDETHFVRKHEDKDIESMKKFIKSAAMYIATDMDADEAKKFIKPE